MENKPDVYRPDEEEEDLEGGPVKTFLEHLEDLRWTLIKVLVALGLGIGICLAAAPQLITILKYPLINAGIAPDLNFLGPIGPVVASMKMGLYGGIVLSLPFILYFIGEFVLPALKANEKRYFMRAMIIGAGLFLLGVMICYFFVLKISIKGLAAYSEWLGVDSQIWRAEEYIQFVTLFMVGMGLSFEFPVVLLTLVKLELVQHEWLLRSRRYFLVINLVICAFITPDPFSTFIMVIPVQLLLEVCIIISKYWERQKKAAEAALMAQSVDNG